MIPSLSSRRCPRALGLVVLLALAPALAAGTAVGEEYDRAVRPDPPGTPTTISYAAYLIDLVAVNDADQSFDADLYVAAVWNDPRLAHAGSTPIRRDASEVWFPGGVTVNARDLERTLPLEVTISPEGQVVYRQRVRGTFSARLDLRNFPLDRQEFRIVMVWPEQGIDELRFEPLPDAPVGRAEDLGAGDWHVGPLEVASGTFLATPTAVPRPELVFSLTAERHVRYYVVQLLLPLVAVMIMAWAPFWLDPTVVPSRLGIPITTMLTLIAFRFMLGGLVPKLPYLTRLDLLLLGSTVLVACAVAYMALSGRMVSLGREEAMRRRDSAARVVFPLAFLAVCAAAALA